MVPVVEDREVLAVAGEVVGETGAGERVGDRVRGEARCPLLAVGHDRRAGRLHPLDRVAARLVLLGDEIVVAGLALVVRGVRLLQAGRSRQRADGLGRDGHDVPNLAAAKRSVCVGH
ncbi:MAG: hypothetical protein WKF58_06880 [Ilumatobacteraceae bacterium]